MTGPGRFRNGAGGSGPKLTFTTMKKSYGWTLTSLLLAATGAQAELADHIYVSAGAGPVIQQDSTAQSAPFSGGNISYDTGVRASLAVGYNFCSAFAAELETGVIWNPIDSINGNTLSSLSSSANLYQIPLLLNGIYKVPLKGAFHPYVGAGVGVAFGLFEGSSVPGLYSPLTGGSMDYSGTDAAFAYQAEVGFKYALGKSAELGLAYKFFGTTGYSWSDNNAPFKTDGTLTHAIMATFDWRF